MGNQAVWWCLKGECRRPCRLITSQEGRCPSQRGLAGGTHLQDGEMCVPRYRKKGWHGKRNTMVNVTIIRRCPHFHVEAGFWVIARTSNKSAAPVFHLEGWRKAYEYMLYMLPMFSSPGLCGFLFIHTFRLLVLAHFSCKCKCNWGHYVDFLSKSETGCWFPCLSTPERGIDSKTRGASAIHGSVTRLLVLNKEGSLCAFNCLDFRNPPSRQLLNVRGVR